MSSVHRLRRSIVVASILCSVAALPAGGQPVSVGCRACVVVDDRGRVLFERDAQQRLANASTTKMVTALVALEELDPDDVVRVPAAVTAVGGGTLDLEVGDRYFVRDLLIAMMLDSSNDAAITLAHAVSGSEKRFVGEMNAWVGEMALTDTAFVTSHGLDEPGHYSSAHDLATIGRLVLDNDVLAGIVTRASAVISTPTGRRRVESRNLLLRSYRGAIGIKTGYTLNAGNVLVAAARRHGRTLIAVAMGSADSFADAALLLDRGFARLSRAVVARQGRPAAALVFDAAGSTPVVLAEAVRGPFPARSVTFRYSPAPGLALPIERGESVGMIELIVRGRVVETVGARALAPVQAPETAWGTDFFSGLLGLFEPLARLA